MLELKVRAKFADTMEDDDDEDISLTERMISWGMPIHNNKLYGSLTGDYIVGPVVDVEEDYINHEYWAKAVPGSVQLYTNMKDSRGEELYQGDVVSPSPMVPGDLDIIPNYKEGDTGTIVWLEGGWMVNFNTAAIKLWQETLLFTKVGETDEAQV